MNEKQKTVKAIKENFLSIYDIEMIQNMIIDNYTIYKARVMYLTYKGFLNKEIADLLNIEVEAVKGHHTSLYKKLSINKPKKQNLIKYISGRYSE